MPLLHQVGKEVVKLLLQTRFRLLLTKDRVTEIFHIYVDIVTDKVAVTFLDEASPVSSQLHKSSMDTAKVLNVKLPTLLEVR